MFTQTFFEWKNKQTKKPNTTFYWCFTFLKITLMSWLTEESQNFLLASTFQPPREEQSEEGKQCLSIIMKIVWAWQTPFPKGAGVLGRPVRGAGLRVL